MAVEIDRKEVTGTGNTWIESFTNLPVKYGGEEIIYSIDEVELLIQKLQYEEDNIKNQNDLFSIEKYILKKFSI